MGRELNKGEASHELSRFLCFAKEGALRGREFGDPGGGGPGGAAGLGGNGGDDGVTRSFPLRTDTHGGRHGNDGAGGASGSNGTLPNFFS
jgi:hypothetical protein